MNGINIVIDNISVIIDSDPKIQKGVYKSQYNKGSKMDQVSALIKKEGKLL